MGQDFFDIKHFFQLFDNFRYSDDDRISDQSLSCVPLVLMDIIFVDYGNVDRSAPNAILYVQEVLARFIW